MLLADIAALLVSLGILAKASDVTVASVGRVSEALGVSDTAVAFLFIAVLTSLPELFVSALASLDNAGAIAVGNVFGSVVANVLLVIGLGAVVYGSIGVPKDGAIRRNSVIAVVLSAIFVPALLLGYGAGALMGLALLAVFAAYTMFLSGVKRRSSAPSRLRADALYQVGVMVASVVVVVLSAQGVVHFASAIASASKMEEWIISATLIALGTSLPELSIFLQAVKARRYGPAMGVMIGSNITDMTLVLGVSALIRPISASLMPMWLIAFAALAGLVLVYLVVRSGKITRNAGALMVLAYLVYVAVAIAN